VDIGCARKAFFHFLVLLSLLQAELCHHPGMAHEKPKDKDEPESKFAEVIRKGKEKRRGMNQQSEERAKAEQASLDREDTNDADQAFKISKDSET